MVRPSPRSADGPFRASGAPGGHAARRMQSGRPRIVLVAGVALVSTRFLTPLIAGLALVAGCGPLGEDEAGHGAGPGHREQELALRPAEELNVGRQAYREVLDEHRDQILPASDQRAPRVPQVVE